MAKTGNKIAAARKAKGLTQQQLAELVGVHWVTISNLERGKTQLTGTWLDAIAYALDVDQYSLIDLPQTRTAAIDGFITRGTAVTEDLHKLNLKQVPLPEPLASAGMWFRIEDDALQPFYHRGDLLFFTWVSDDVASDITGRLCAFLTVDEEAARRTIQIGFLEKYSEGRATRRLVNGITLRDVPTDAVGLMTAYKPALDLQVQKHSENH